MDIFELNCPDRDIIVKGYTEQLNIFGQWPKNTLPNGVRIPNYVNAWHFAAKVEEDGKTIRFFRPGVYTVLSPHYAVAYVDGVFQFASLTAIDARYGTELGIAKN